MYMSQKGDLYFANVEERDSRNDYCCFAAFPRLRTIVQKMPMKLTVNSCESKSLLFRGGRMRCVCGFILADASGGWGGAVHRCFSSMPETHPDEGLRPRSSGVSVSRHQKTAQLTDSIFRLPSAGLVIFSGRNTVIFRGFPGTSQTLTHRINQLQR